MRYERRYFARGAERARRRRPGTLALRLWAIAATVCFLACACAKDEPPFPDPTCEGLWGVPDQNTGLSDDVCFPRIEGAELVWEPRAWTQEQLDELRSWILENPPEVLLENPYIVTPDVRPNESRVCAVIVSEGEPTRYRLQTYRSVRAAERDGAIVTHGTECGSCSALADLVAYIETPDQTEPVRRCGLENLGGTVEDLQACIQKAVGFSAACARMWAYDSFNTNAECQEICLLELESPYNRPDGSLNPCLQCDEDNSGPVFKALAGRTRRDSGVPSAICRPCDEVWRVAHDYGDQNESVGRSDGSGSEL